MYKYTYLFIHLLKRKQKYNLREKQIYFILIVENNAGMKEKQSFKIKLIKY